MEIKDLQIDNFETYFRPSSLSNNDNIRTMIVSWSANIGFGELTIVSREDTKTNETNLYIDTEHMGKDFAKKVLCKLVDEAEEV